MEQIREEHENRDFSKEFNFLKQYLNNLHINVTILDTASLVHSDNIHFGVYSLIYSKESIERYFAHIMSTYKERILYKVSDMYMTSYYIFIMPGEKKSACLVGPFAVGDITNEDIVKFILEYNLQESLTPTLMKYYGSLRRITDTNIIQTLLNTYMSILWGGMDQFELIDVDVPHNKTKLESASPTESTPAQRTIRDMRLLQERYEVENELLRAISKGELHTAEMLVAKFESMQVAENRAADPIRNIKNYSIIFNSLFRKAAEQGKVHPLHINQLSSQLAIKIEKARSIDELTAIRREMVRKYCFLVKNHSMMNYSQLIQRALTIINGDIAADLTLSSLAEELNVNASYLSTQFKKELGQTLTDYVKKKRIEHAVLLLNSTEYPVADIAEICGIPDVQYFSKQFKAQIGYSPLTYRKMIR